MREICGVTEINTKVVGKMLKESDSREGGMGGKNTRNGFLIFQL